MVRPLGEVNIFKHRLSLRLGKGVKSRQMIFIVVINTINLSRLSDFVKCR